VAVAARCTSVQLTSEGEQDVQSCAPSARERHRVRGAVRRAGRDVVRRREPAEEQRRNETAQDQCGSQSRYRQQRCLGVQVAANTLKGADIDEASLGKVPSAKSADSSTSAASATNATNAADAAKLGGLAPSAFQKGVRWALVNNAGSAIVAQSGGFTIFSHPFPGESFVDFGSPTAGHPVWAMNSDLDNLATQGAATAGPCGVAPDAYPNCATANHANRVHVATHQANGTLADRSFYVYLLP
jgi:hypothetical protein